MALELVRNLDRTLQVEVIQHAAFYEHRLQVHFPFVTATTNLVLYFLFLPYPP